MESSKFAGCQMSQIMKGHGAAKSNKELNPRTNSWTLHQNWSSSRPLYMHAHDTRSSTYIWHLARCPCLAGSQFPLYILRPPWLLIVQFLLSFLLISIHSDPCPSPIHHTICCSHYNRVLCVLHILPSFLKFTSCSLC